MRSVLCLAAIVLPFGFAVAQEQPAQTAEKTVEVAVERLQGDTWAAVDSRIVFKPEDEIRFRFRSSSLGYLYVLNQTSKGKYIWLFPSKEAGLDNRVNGGTSYIIPSTDGGFRIPETPGFDTVYFILSTVELPDVKNWTPGGNADSSSPLLPRCNDSILKSRGECMDDNAGVRPLTSSPTGSGLPGDVLRARDLIFEKHPDASVVKVKQLSEGTLIYELWIAHH